MLKMWKLEARIDKFDLDNFNVILFDSDIISVAFTLSRIWFYDIVPIEFLFGHWNWKLSGFS